MSEKKRRESLASLLSYTIPDSDRQSEDRTTSAVISPIQIDSSFIAEKTSLQNIIPEYSRIFFDKIPLYFMSKLGTVEETDDWIYMGIFRRFSIIVFQQINKHEFISLRPQPRFL